MLSKVSIGEKGALELYFDEAKETAKASIFDKLSTAKVENDGSETRILVFPFKPPTGVRNEGKTEDELLDITSQDMSKVKNQLTQILELYLTNDEINKTYDPYAGTGVDGTNYRTMLRSEDVLEKIFANMANWFVNLVTPFVGDPKYKLRLKLVRQSKDKHFATLPGKFLEQNPMVELMDVPAPMVKFTKWEIDNGLNDGTPVARPAGGEEAEGGAAKEGDNAFSFGQR